MRYDLHKSTPNHHPLNTLGQKVYGGRGRGDYPNIPNKPNQIGVAYLPPPTSYNLTSHKSPRSTKEGQRPDPSQPRPKA